MKRALLNSHFSNRAVSTKALEPEEAIRLSYFRKNKKVRIVGDGTGSLEHVEFLMARQGT